MDNIFEEYRKYEAEASDLLKRAGRYLESGEAERAISLYKNSEYFRRQAYDVICRCFDENDIVSLRAISDYLFDSKKYQDAVFIAFAVARESDAKTKELFLQKYKNYINFELYRSVLFSKAA